MHANNFSHLLGSFFYVNITFKIKIIAFRGNNNDTYSAELLTYLRIYDGVSAIAINTGFNFRANSMWCKRLQPQEALLKTSR